MKRSPTCCRHPAGQCSVHPWDTCHMVQRWTSSIVLYDLHVLWLCCLVLCIHCIVLPSFVAKLLLINCIIIIVVVLFGAFISL